MAYSRAGQLLKVSIENTMAREKHRKQMTKAKNWLDKFDKELDEPVEFEDIPNNNSDDKENASITANKTSDQPKTKKNLQASNLNILHSTLQSQAQVPTNNDIESVSVIENVLNTSTATRMTIEDNVQNGIWWYKFIPIWNEIVPIWNDFIPK